MSFIETPRFPLDVNYGTMGGPTFSTDIVRFANGAEVRNANWSIPLYSYDIRYAVKSRDQIVNVYEFFLARQGKAEGFRVKDLWDFSTSTDGKSSPARTDQTLGTGDDSETDFQLIKVYTKGSGTISRILKKPVSGTVLVEVNGVAKTEGVDYTVDYTTGIITFSSPVPLGHVVKAGCEFDVPVRFDKDNLDDLAMIAYGPNGTDYGSIESIPLVELRNP